MRLRSDPIRWAVLAAAASGAVLPLACKTDSASSEGATTAKPAEQQAAATPAAAPDAGPPPAQPLNRLTRAEFNRYAAELFVPVFWSQDANNDGIMDPNEVAVLWRPGVSRAAYLGDAGFSEDFKQAYERMVEAKTAGDAKLTGEGPDAARRAALLKELRQGRPTLVLNKFQGATDEDKAILTHVLAAAEIVERLHARQNGTYGLAEKIAADDTLGRAVFHRNQSPFCEAPATRNDEACTALPEKPARVVGIYPADIQAQKDFCETLSKRPDADTLMDPFHAVVKDEKGDLKAIPYTEAFKEDMTAASKELKAAADAITSTEEAAFKTYLLAASQAFLDNNWQPADEAWSKMSVANSKWYLRVGPDEVYWDPCSRHAGFHVSFARINKDSITWQQKLDPVKGDMEKALAALAGKPYKARKVSFHLPDFIDVVVNAGDARAASGATIGQSLPNWGPVANEGRGRTVAMTNFYTDEDSKRSLKEQVESLLCKDSMASFTSDPTPQVMSTVLHEAAHNLGPAHEYKVKGKTDDQIFGGPMASTLEELKAQTSALYFTDWLVEKKLISKEEADKAHVRDVAWAFGHISRGMYQDNNKPLPYSQLAAIQMGFLKKEGAIEWRAAELAANGKDTGCFALKLDAFPKAINKLAKNVLGIKGRGDQKLAEAMKKEFVDDDGEWKTLRATIQERWLRAPKSTFVYAVEF